MPTDTRQGKLFGSGRRWVAPVCPSEHEEQAALVRVCALHEHRWPELALLFAIPNGGHRAKATAGRLRAEGVKPGVPDLFLPVARKGAWGLFIEMKRLKGGRIDPAQVEWALRLSEQGYRVEVCRGWSAAWNVIRKYLEGE